MQKRKSVTVERVESCIVKKQVESIELVGKIHTLVAVELVNGFSIIETSTCVDPNNYSLEIGTQVCLDRIMNKIWLLEGYLLQEELSK